jgi:ABC-type glutathione transport system ATPase component
VKNLRTAFAVGGECVEAVRGVSFSIAPGEVLGLIGESGSGKTVTGLSLLRLLPPHASVAADAIRFRGKELAGLSDDEFRNLQGVQLAMIFQDPVGSFNPAKTVAWHLKQAIARRQGSAGDRNSDWLDEAGRILQDVGIRVPARVLASHPHQLSGGMLQRALIAMVIALRPAFIIADEPTTNLDNLVERQILDLIRVQQRKLGASVLFVTHDLAVAARSATVLRSCMRVRSSRSDPPAMSSSGHGIPMPRDCCRRPPRSTGATSISTNCRASRADEAPRKDAASWHAARRRSRNAARHSPAWSMSAPATHRSACCMTSDQSADMTSDATMRVRDLTLDFRAAQRFGRARPLRALDSVDLDIAAGEIVGLVGESGSGKTTLGKTILGAFKPTSGQILYLGHDLATLPPRRWGALRRDLQMIFQDPLSSFNPRFTIESSLSLPLRLHGICRRSAYRTSRRCSGASVSARSTHGAIRTSCRWPAPAGGYCARHQREPAHHRRRRTGLQARRLGAGAGSEPPQADESRDRRGSRLHHPRPRRGALPVRPDRGDVFRAHRGNWSDRAGLR